MKKEYVLSLSILKTIVPACILVIGLVVCCGTNIKPRALFSGDITPPIFFGAMMTSSNTLVIHFNEEISHVENLVSENLNPESATIDNQNIHVYFTETVVPGECYSLRLTAQDQAGNKMICFLPFFGFNPQPANLVINEFITKGSSNHPDWIEFEVLEEGDLGGLTVYLGTSRDYSSRFVFPSCLVKTGDYLILHTKPEGLDTEINETVDCSISEGKECSDSAWDFWLPEGSGLSANNGIITLTNYPSGPISDGVIYSNRVYCDKNCGFSSASFKENVEFIVNQEQWSPSLISPETVINPERSTATRSINRRKTRDSNEKENWYITATGNASPGSINSDEIFSEDP